jgi:hypothetical protein
MSLLDSARRRWFLLAAAWAALLVLGIGGFIQQADDGNFPRSNLETLYLTVQLATLEYEGGDNDLNWRLEVARFVAPLIAAGTVLQTASVILRDQFMRFRLRFLKGHTVVAGLGAAGSRLAMALQGEGHQVVAVDLDASAPGFPLMREHEIPAIVGDATDADVLTAVRVDRAARVVVLCATDATNVAVAAAVRGVSRAAGRPALRCSVHLTDAELCGLLRGADLGGPGKVRVDFFNLHERASRAWLGEVDSFGDGSRRPHVAVLGLGQLGRSLVVATAQRWCESGDGPLQLTLVDREATGRWHALRLQHPALAAATDTFCLDLDLEAPTADAADAFRTLLASDPPTSVAVAFEDESLALSSALLVYQAMRDPAVPVVVRTDADAGLGGLVTPVEEGAQPPFPGLALFPFLDRACTPEIVEGGVREQLARAMHEDHVARTGSGHGLHRPWEELDDDERESSRAAADAIIEGLAAVGYELVPLRHWGAAAARLDAAEIDRLAAGEHQRWFDERTEAGWTHGERRDDARKLNPLLLGWDDLTEADRDTNRAGVEAWPDMLARAGFELVPKPSQLPS